MKIQEKKRHLVRLRKLNNIMRTDLLCNPLYRQKIIPNTGDKEQKRIDPWRRDAKHKNPRHADYF